MSFCLFTFFRIEPHKSLFNGIVKMSANMSSDASSLGSGQCLLSPKSGSENSRNCGNNFASNGDNSILDLLIQLGNNADFSPFTRLAVDAENELVDPSSSEEFGLTSPRNSNSGAGSSRIRPPSLSEISFAAVGLSKEPADGKNKKCQKTIAVFKDLRKNNLTR